MPRTSREIQLAARPTGEPTDEQFHLTEVEVPDPGPGEVRVRTEWMSVDPAMRGRMNAGRSYVPPFEVGEPMTGGAVGTVDAVGEGVDGLAEGDLVLTQLGWREYGIAPAREARKLDTSVAEPQHFLGVLGMPGLTAYAGLYDVAGLRDGDVVFVSGAAGAVGSMVGQLAKLRGNTVIGSAGSAEKVAWLTDELGFDAAFNYKDGPVHEQLREAAPDGIDVYFDNVGGEHLEAAIGRLNEHGRAALCGAISTYNASEPPPGPRNMMRLVQFKLRLVGFIVIDHFHRMREFVAEVAPKVADGTIKHRETVVEGLEQAPEALLGLFRGDNTGKMLVRVAS
jgi:NADPH-dependent curcumin reductase CurA